MTVTRKSRTGTREPVRLLLSLRVHDNFDHMSEHIDYEKTDQRLLTGAELDDLRPTVIDLVSQHGGMYIVVAQQREAIDRYRLDASFFDGRKRMVLTGEQLRLAESSPHEFEALIEGKLNAMRGATNGLDNPGEADRLSRARAERDEAAHRVDELHRENKQLRARVDELTRENTRLRAEYAKLLQARETIDPLAETTYERDRAEAVELVEAMVAGAGFELLRDGGDAKGAMWQQKLDTRPGVQIFLTVPEGVLAAGPANVFAFVKANVGVAS